MLALCVLSLTVPPSTVLAEPVLAPAFVPANPSSFVLPSPYRISPKARAGTIRYRLSFARPLAWAWPETGEQHAERSADGIVLTICKTCGQEPAPTQAALRRYLEPNAWADSDSGAVRNFAKAARGGSVEARMTRLAGAVRVHMTGPIDYRGYQSASEALRARQGDCTEFAVLLAAAARARGIPARVVAGLAYTSRFVGKPHTFGPHMWVQAWTGQSWVSYDAGLGAFDAGHIALSIGNGDPNGFGYTMAAIARLRIDRMEGVENSGADP